MYVARNRLLIGLLALIVVALVALLPVTWNLRAATGGREFHRRQHTGADDDAAPIASKIPSEAAPTRPLPAATVVGDDDQDEGGGEVFQFTHAQAHHRDTGNNTSSNDAVAPLSTRVWPMGDHNAGFHGRPDLPRVAVVSINSQKGPRGAPHRGVAGWLHRLSYHNKFQYTKKWKYDLIIEDNEVVARGRSVVWSKLRIIKKWLPYYQWVMWVDMDAFFMRLDQRLDHLLDDDYDFIVTRDWNGMNLGVFFIRNSPYGESLLQTWWDTPQNWWIPFEEQSALSCLFDKKMVGDAAKTHLSHVKFDEQRRFNAYGAEFAHHFPTSRYKDGDFLVHFPDCRGFATCERTVHQFYQKMLSDNDVQELDPSVRVPEYVVPVTNKPVTGDPQ